MLIDGTAPVKARLWMRFCFVVLWDNYQILTIQSWGGVQDDKAIADYGIASFSGGT